MAVFRKCMACLAACGFNQRTAMWLCMERYTSGPGGYEGRHHAELYLKYRPDLPQSILQRSLNFLNEKRSPPFTLAVDVGCGPGQSTRPLTPHFEKVVGIDVSEAQISAARHEDNPSNVEFRVGQAEKIDLPDESVDLVSCATAVHWFDVQAFFLEVNRVLKPGGCLSIYNYFKMYPWVDGDDEKNEMIKNVIAELDIETGVNTCGPVNSARNMLLNISIPYEENMRYNLEIRHTSTLTSYLGYLRSMFGYQAYINANPDAMDPHKKVKERLMSILELPSQETSINIKYPVALLLGRKSNQKTS